jgi:hypothetical protein
LPLFVRIWRSLPPPSSSLPPSLPLLDSSLIPPPGSRRFSSIGIAIGPSTTSAWLLLPSAFVFDALLVSLPSATPASSSSIGFLRAGFFLWLCENAAAAAAADEDAVAEDDEDPDSCTLTLLFWFCKECSGRIASKGLVLFRPPVDDASAATLTPSPPAPLSIGIG